MLFSVGMYLPLETTFAIFIGGMIKGFVSRIGGEPRLQRRAEGARRERGRPRGVGTHRGRGADGPPRGGRRAFRADNRFPQIGGMFESIGGWLAIPVMLILAAYLIFIPLKKAGAADEPAPPTAVM